MFACEAAGVVPDIITLSKALTGGTLPLAATVARKQVFDAFWSDDPDARADARADLSWRNALACAAANASLDLFEREPRLEQVAAISAQLARGLAPCRELPGVKDVRVKGAIGVVELEHASHDLERAARALRRARACSSGRSATRLSDAGLHHRAEDELWRVADREDRVREGPDRVASVFSGG